MSFLYGSVIIVTQVCNIKPFDLTLNNSTFSELDFLLQWPCCTLSPLAIRITLIPKLFLFIASKSYLHTIKGKLFHPREPKENNLLINSSKNSSKMRL